MKTRVRAFTVSIALNVSFIEIGILKDKKAAVRAIAEQVNDLKMKIESIKDQISKMENEPVLIEDLNELRNDGTKVIDEAQYQTLVLLKETKANYKRTFENWKSARGEMEYCERMVGQCRERFLAEFEQWYEDTYGAFIPSDNGNPGLNAASLTSPTTNEVIL
jgi:hypothetical protein